MLRRQPGFLGEQLLDAFEVTDGAFLPISGARGLAPFLLRRTAAMRCAIVGLVCRVWRKNWCSSPRFSRRGLLEQAAGITLELSELRDLFDALESLYMALLLGKDGRGLPLKQESDIYARPNHSFHKFFLSTNMDDVLDNVAKNSLAWNLPEMAPMKMMQFTNEQIARLDAYRQERGMPKIALSRGVPTNVVCAY